MLLSEDSICLLKKIKIVQFLNKCSIHMVLIPEIQKMTSLSPVLPPSHSVFPSW